MVFTHGHKPLDVKMECYDFIELNFRKFGRFYPRRFRLKTIMSAPKASTGHVAYQTDMKVFLDSWYNINTRCFCPRIILLLILIFLSTCLLPTMEVRISRWSLSINNLVISEIDNNYYLFRSNKNNKTLFVY